MKLKYFLTTLLLTSMLTLPVLGGTVITSPIDSRPISTDYLGNLVELGGDDYIPLSNDSLDFFSVYDNLNYFGDSQSTRKELSDLVSANNTTDTTVIINTSSYITGGLVGSRCGINYMGYKKALDDLHQLITDNPNPTYYINLSMPRSLPETRFNQIWRDNNELMKGLGYYYVQNNPKCEDRLYINKNYSMVNATQFLMEYGYVANKQAELGEDSLTPWEKDFLEIFNRKYLKKEPYKSYIYKYKLPYVATSDIFRKLTTWQNEGLIDEIIISNDDLQIPNVITYFYNQDADWINTENGSAIKFSFARTYMSTGLSSIYNQMNIKFGEKTQKSALAGTHDSINYIFGTDEIPQLIYARDLTKRKNLSTNINPYISSTTKGVGTYDVVGINELITSDVNFVNANIKDKTETPLDLYLYDYLDTSENRQSSFLDNMKQSYNDKNHVGLIEIFSPDVSNTGANDVFKTLLASKEGLTITKLASYSAWNTNANAIGLGVAHSQVYAISNELATGDIDSDGNGNISPSQFLSSQIKVLSQHIFEDGIFTIQIKRALANEGFKPTMENDISHSQKLYSMLNTDEILGAFLNTTYSHNGIEYQVDSCTLDEYSFPWCRNFECFLDINSTLSEK